jgi:hypothetical protein
MHPGLPAPLRRMRTGCRPTTPQLLGMLLQGLLPQGSGASAAGGSGGSGQPFPPFPFPMPGNVTGWEALAEGLLKQVSQSICGGMGFTAADAKRGAVSYCVGRDWAGADNHGLAGVVRRVGASLP